MQRPLKNCSICDSGETQTDYHLVEEFVRGKLPEEQIQDFRSNITAETFGHFLVTKVSRKKEYNSKVKKHHLIFVPGLGDNVPPLTWAVNRFKSDLFVPHIYEAPWRPPGEDFKPKLERLISLIDQLARDGQVSLVGISAGASLVLNAYLQRKNQITKVVNIAGRLRAGGIPSLDFTSRVIPAFRDSVLMFEENEQNLTKTDRKKVLTIRGIFDELVPPQTTILKGSTNIQLPLVEHNIIIYSTLIFYKKRISIFLRDH